jgi:hypothetical protein
VKLLFVMVATVELKYMAPPLRAEFSVKDDDESVKIVLVNLNTPPFSAD